jgi:hypothetical protein
MGITQYQRAKKFINTLKREKGEIVSFDDFIFAMRIHISNDKTRVQKPYFELMKELKLIEQAENGTIRLF